MRRSDALERNLSQSANGGTCFDESDVLGTRGVAALIRPRDVKGDPGGTRRGQQSQPST